MNKLEITALVGVILRDIQISTIDVRFIAQDGRMWKLYHEQDCCECVYLEDVVGNISDLLNTPIIMAEEVNSDDPPIKKDGGSGYVPESYTWTFYKFATIKGYVTLRWYGTSNGYYSERVTFAQIV